MTTQPTPEDREATRIAAWLRQRAIWVDGAAAMALRLAADDLDSRKHR